MLGWWGSAGFGVWAAVSWILEGASGGSVLSGFARIFGYLDGDGSLQGPVGVSPLAPLHRLADGLGGWLRLLASLFVVLLFQIQKHFKEVRDASRSDYVIPASRPSRKLQAVPGEGFSRAVLPHGNPRGDGARLRS